MNEIFNAENESRAAAIGCALTMGLLGAMAIIALLGWLLSCLL